MKKVFLQSGIAAPRPRRKRAALRELCRKYLPEKMDVADEHISHSLARTAIFKLVPARITGKAKRP